MEDQHGEDMHLQRTFRDPWTTQKEDTILRVQIPDFIAKEPMINQAINDYILVIQYSLKAGGRNLEKKIAAKQQQKSSTTRCSHKKSSVKSTKTT